jgi:hypothetical protein
MTQDEQIAGIKQTMQYNIEANQDVHLYSISVAEHTRIRMKASADFGCKIWLMNEFEGVIHIASVAAPARNAEHYTQVAVWTDLVAEDMPVEPEAEEEVVSE